MPKSTACRRCGTDRHWTGSRWRCSPCYNDWQSGRRESLSPERRSAERAIANANQLVNRAAWSDAKRSYERARTQAWRESNPERHRAGARDWYQRNAEYARAAKLAEYRANPEAFYARNLTRKARVLAAVCGHGAKCVDAKFLKGIYATECIYCGDPAEHADHFYPLARGGLHCVENIVPACGSCNSRKKDMDPFAWLERQGISTE